MVLVHQDCSFLKIFCKITNLGLESTFSKLNSLRYVITAAKGHRTDLSKFNTIDSAWEPEKYILICLVLFQLLLLQ